VILFFFLHFCFSLRRKEEGSVRVIPSTPRVVGWLSVFFFWAIMTVCERLYLVLLAFSRRVSWRQSFGPRFLKPRFPLDIVDAAFFPPPLRRIMRFLLMGLGWFRGRISHLTSFGGCFHNSRPGLVPCLTEMRHRFYFPCVFSSADESEFHLFLYLDMILSVVVACRDDASFCFFLLLFFLGSAVFVVASFPYLIVRA